MLGKQIALTHTHHQHCYMKIKFSRLKNKIHQTKETKSKERCGEERQSRKRDVGKKESRKRK